MSKPNKYSGQLEDLATNSVPGANLGTFFRVLELVPLKTLVVGAFLFAAFKPEYDGVAIGAFGVFAVLAMLRNVMRPYW